ncbi:hypothetical protein LSH36_113g04008 [Paralvinella palmiformis]|uniref:Palmitoyltransferase n=1 Tax=Paralvinella palmiformis TaxID=53620 RepID=A0AAD9K045_9ANNE|nr:hypothetical protein LSH36_113g04008 [Paralvinella palmiformis]
MPCCCDCEAIDNLCDRCCRCQSITVADVDKVLSNIQDRCRFPACSGRGAIQIHLDLVVPLILIPLGLFISSYGNFFMYTVFPMFVMILLGYYRVWKRRTKRTKSRFFYSWSITSCLTLYYVFQLVITVYREVLFWENLLFSTMFALMMYCLYVTRCDPGIVQTMKVKPNGHRRISSQGKLTNSELIASKGPSIAGWNMSVVWCDSCQSEVPASSAHCPVCDVCIISRDHHCI